MFVNVMFMPHPPIIIDSIGGKERENARCTIEGMTILAKKIAKLKPETIVFVTPHGNSFSNGTCILSGDIISGDFGAFGHEEIRVTKTINTELSQKIYDCFEERNFIAVLMDYQLAHNYNINIRLDHGVMVPMYFIDKYYKDYNIVHMTPGQTPLEENYFLGKLMKDMVDDYTHDDPSKVLIIVSGDLSHALSSDGPYSYHKNGPIFDSIVKEAITQKNPIELVKLSRKFTDDASQCGLRSFLMGFGYMDGIDYESKVLSYEGPFGVGYLTGYLETNMIKATKSITSNRGLIKGNSELSHIHTILDLVNRKYEERKLKEDDYITLARQTIEHYVRTKTKFVFDEANYSQQFVNEIKEQSAGVFVSIHSDGALRGCIGTTEATTDHLVDEIIYNAMSACSSDPRFHPIEEDELSSLEISVDILKPIETIETLHELDINKYGVIVEQGYKRGLLLPNLEGVDSVNDQVSIAKQKAGIVSGKVKLYRFEVIRHEVE